MREDILFGSIAVQEGFVTATQIEECLLAQDGRPLGEVLRDQGLVTEEQLQAILDIQKVRAADAEAPSPSGGLFGRIAVRAGYVTPEALREAVREQIRRRRRNQPARLGDILCEQGRLDPARCDEILRQQRQNTICCPECDTCYLVASVPAGTRFVCRRCMGLLTVPDRPDAPPQVVWKGGFTVGPYRVMDILGRGAMSIVFKALHLPTRAAVALKVLKRSLVLHPDALPRFQAEARAAAALAHPHIVRVHDTGEADGMMYIAMDLVEGSTLRQAIERGKTPKRRLLEILERVARAVHHAHGRGIVHRDLKPENILLDAADEPHVTDFGLARMGDRESVPCRDGDASLGTPGYMAPEQARGDLESTDARVDVHALGVMLYEILAGRPPYPGRTPAEVRGRLLEGRPEPLPPGLPRELGMLVMQAIELDRDRRTSSAAGLADAVREFLDTHPDWKDNRGDAEARR